MDALFPFIVPDAVLSNSTALFLECVHCHLNWTGKGVNAPPPRLTRLLAIVTRNEKQRSKARQNRFETTSVIFFAQVNIEVISGHQMSNFAKFHIFRKCVVITETIIDRRLRKSVIDSP